MAKLLTPKIKRLLLDSAQQFIVAIFVFAFAIALTFVEDFCRNTHRPPWIIVWIEVVSVWLAAVDGIALICISGYTLFSSIQEFVRRTRGD